MTDPDTIASTPQAVIVTEADREAAAAFQHPNQAFFDASRPSISERASWGFDLVQAFARRADEAVKADRERQRSAGFIPLLISDWFKRNSDRKSPQAFVNTNPAYFGDECAALIQDAIRNHTTGHPA